LRSTIRHNKDTKKVAMHGFMTTSSLGTVPSSVELKAMGDGDFVIDVRLSGAMSVYTPLRHTPLPRCALSSGTLPCSTLSGGGT